MKDFKTYANSFQATARLQLEGITTLLDFLSHPERDLKFVHVAGTNGKGSVCAFLSEIFTSAGYKCGKYISPNLVNVCERISINGEDISEEELNVILEKVEKASDKAKEKLGESPTQFEIWTAAAFFYFKEKMCDIVVLETGLGGARDATNVILSPIASVITRIAADHTEYLGDTLEEIALQKAGIIKRGGITVTCPQGEIIEKVLKDVCEEKENRFVICDSAQVHKPEGTNEVISYKNLKNIKIGISGMHQIENACIAAETAMSLGIDEKYIISGIAKAKNPGRFEIVRENLIFDGAHNPNGTESLVKSLKRYFPGETPVFVTAMMADKDISGSAEILKNAYENVKVFTTAVADNPRSDTAENLAKRFSEQKIEVYPCKDLKDAIKKAGSGIVVVCGSLYLYKDMVLCGFCG